MSKESVTKPVPSNREVETVPLVTESKYTVGRRLRRIIKIVIYALALLLAYCIGNFHGWESREALILRSGIYVYDTEQKLEEYYAAFERGFVDKTGFTPDSPATREYMVMTRRTGRPLVAIGPFSVFVYEDSGNFSVREMQSLLPLVELESNGQSKRLNFHSSLEKDWYLPRFAATFSYSEDGAYKWSSFMFQEKDGTIARHYLDTKGIGVLNRMVVFENGISTRYELKGLSWEKIDDEEQPERDVADEDEEHIIKP
jgi:hypothetical protein